MLYLKEAVNDSGNGRPIILNERHIVSFERLEESDIPYENHTVLLTLIDDNIYWLTEETLKQAQYVERWQDLLTPE